VRVYVRIRPLTQAEAQKAPSSAAVDPSKGTVVLRGMRGEQPRSFTFDGVLSESASQHEAFELAGRAAAADCLAGYNGSTYVYGQTGAGKTYSVFGCPANSVAELMADTHRGFACRALEQVFAEVGRHTREAAGLVNYTCTCSFLEIYKEQIIDLLDPSSVGLQIRADPVRGVYVDRLYEPTVTSLEEACDVLFRGLQHRRSGATHMNERSSRSHAVFALSIQAIEQCPGGLTSTRVGRLSFVDLAGSERQQGLADGGLSLGVSSSTAGAVGGSGSSHADDAAAASAAAQRTRVREAGAINRSLSALTNVIASLAREERARSKALAAGSPGGSGAEGAPKAFVNFRDSKLTFLMRDSLGGNSRTSIVAHISPAVSSCAESLSTLKFAARAKCVRCTSVPNVQFKSESTGSLKEEVKSLRQLLSNLGEKLNTAQIEGASDPQTEEQGARNVALHAQLAAARQKLIDVVGELAQEQAHAQQELDEVVNELVREQARARMAVHPALTTDTSVSTACSHTQASQSPAASHSQTWSPGMLAASLASLHRSGTSSVFTPAVQTIASPATSTMSCVRTLPTCRVRSTINLGTARSTSGPSMTTSPTVVRVTSGLLEPSNPSLHTSRSALEPGSPSLRTTGPCEPGSPSHRPSQSPFDLGSPVRRKASGPLDQGSPSMWPSPRRGHVEAGSPSMRSAVSSVNLGSPTVRSTFNALDAGSPSRRLAHGNPSSPAIRSAYGAPEPGSPNVVRSPCGSIGSNSPSKRLVAYSPGSPSIQPGSPVTSSTSGFSILAPADAGSTTFRPAPASGPLDVRNTTFRSASGPLDIGCLGFRSASGSLSSRGVIGSSHFPRIFQQVAQAHTDHGSWNLETIGREIGEDGLGSTLGFQTSASSSSSHPQAVGAVDVRDQGQTRAREEDVKADAARGQARGQVPEVASEAGACSTASSDSGLACTNEVASSSSASPLASTPRTCRAECDGGLKAFEDQAEDCGFPKASLAESAQLQFGTFIVDGTGCPSEELGTFTGGAASVPEHMSPTRRAQYSARLRSGFCHGSSVGAQRSE